MKIRSRCIVAAVVYVLGGLVAQAADGPAPLRDWPNLAVVDAIDVVQLSQYTPDEPDGRQPADTGLISNEQELADALTIRGPGTYIFKSVQILKGDSEPEFQVHLPRVSAYYYAWTQFELKPGTRLLLLLKKDKNKHWAPVDPYIPVIPLSLAGDPHASPDSHGAISKPKPIDAIDWILASLPDAKIRPALVHVLREVVNERVVSAVRPLADDKDPRIRADALRCMAANQDLAAISKIANLAKEVETTQVGWAPTDALRFYKDPKVVPFLNPLVVDGTDFIRLNAMAALRPIADDTSIPFLMKALDNDDAQHTVAYGAYYTLHRLIGRSLPPALSLPQFYARRDEEIAVLKQWWEWEQMKAKKAAATQTRPAPATSQVSPSTAPASH